MFLALIAQLFLHSSIYELIIQEPSTGLCIIGLLHFEAMIKKKNIWDYGNKSIKKYYGMGCHIHSSI